jgi:hypothetical protein
MELILLWCIGANARFGKVRDLIARKRPVASGRLGSGGDYRPQPAIGSAQMITAKRPFAAYATRSTLVNDLNFPHHFAKFLGEKRVVIVPLTGGVFE